MPDRSDSTAAGRPADTPSTPTSWEEHPAFREHFLAFFPPDAAESFRAAGRHLYDAALEGEAQDILNPWVRVQVRALVEDLRFTAEVFADLADLREFAGLAPPEFELAGRCKAWAGEVLALVLGIEGALDGGER